MQGLWPIAGQGSFVLVNRSAIILAPAYGLFSNFKGARVPVVGGSGAHYGGVQVMDPSLTRLRLYLFPLTSKTLLLPLSNPPHLLPNWQWVVPTRRLPRLLLFGTRPADVGMILTARIMLALLHAFHSTHSQAEKKRIEIWCYGLNYFQISL